MPERGKETEGREQDERQDDEPQEGGPPEEALPLGALDTRAMIRLFVVGFVAKAWQCLGVLPHPTSGRRERNLPDARLAIDAIDALLHGVRAGLEPEGAGGLEAAVAELKLAYVRAKAQGEAPGGGSAGPGGGTAGGEGATAGAGAGGGTASEPGGGGPVPG